MSDDKSIQESQFNLDAIKESIERMKPELATCSAVAHKSKDADAGDDPEFDRVVELGSLVECPTAQSLRCPAITVAAAGRSLPLRLGSSILL